MRRQDFGELNAFMVVAQERSFTRAAGILGTSQSTLSQTIQRLETRLGLQLLTRSTRSVAATEAGERLLETLTPAFSGIDAKLADLTQLRDKPAGIVRINATEHVTQTLLWPVLARLLPDYPDIQVEIVSESGLVDIVSGRYDGGVRIGELVEKDMIAVRIGPQLKMVAVASPAYFARKPKPLKPHDLADHTCINLRFPSSGGLYSWEFEKEGQALRVRVEGALTFNSGSMLVAGALDGFGIAYVTNDYVDNLIADGRLVKVLEDWSPPFAGYHLYYPGRKSKSPAFALIVEALRYRG
ncbi:MULTISPECIES: LysR family transcriptional regulator [Pseudomonas]|uniref:HTH-type transcriptional regulator PgrR n=1 Tax=Pseudomonas frederiksbergensis TaxID=104087 RepID=A0A6L5C6T0_9PSED|nr:MULTISPECIES: LysR family transcriptional regulator [Pseudomonas]KAF2395107.1 HTH-type transcriptional regulator PgrR [Pseudomonas frederiksbergensis]MDN3221450.1 LysR family transcriptional regulator [Pseudomonas nunensis]